ncbi:hypothetical protein CC2G_010704 [Coprinopsis cinerea AmutBmut pab1-1]|nr:hypothetical protein CC2G_010704 [Coprinopsis cinerea AmutBmut pab1-1]
MERVRGARGYDGAPLIDATGTTNVQRASIADEAAKRISIMFLQPVGTNGVKEWT